MLCVLFISLLCFSLVLCTNPFHFCVNETFLSCSYQLWSNETEDACQVKRYELKSSDCQAKLPETPIKKNPIDRGFIKIEPFKDPQGMRTIFRVIASNITWNNLKIRFQLQNTISCMKREFFIKKNVPNDAYLIYDCPWSTAAFEDKIIDFEYTYGIKNTYDDKRTFLIHVPKNEALDNFNSSYLPNVTLFTYVETTNLYQLICKIHAPQVNVTSYEIIVHFTKNNVTRTDGPFLKDAKSAVSGVIDFEYYTSGIPGEYFFSVRPCSTCRRSVSPVVIIPDTSIIITIGIVGVSCLIPIFLIIIYLFFKVESGSVPRVLLITTPANNAHKTIGKSLANLLIQKYNIPTMIDIQDISIQKKIPPEWLRNSFDCATHIVILMSDDKPVTSIYRNIDHLLFSLMQSNHNKICCCIKFPFSQKAKLNINIQRNFKLMQDYKAFINFIHNRGFLHRLIHKVIRNDLYYDLIKQINNYQNNITVPQSLNSVCCDSNECTHQNEINNLRSSMEQPIEEKDEYPPGLSEMVEKCLQPDNLSMNTDTQSIDSTLEALLEVSPN